MNVTLNDNARLYVIPYEKGGHSCLGYDVVYKRTIRLLRWLGMSNEGAAVMAPENTVGTFEGYQIYRRARENAQQYAEQYKTQCPVDLTPQLIGLERKRVEVLDCDGETRRFWVEKSTGWMPCHLEIARRDSSGGGAVMGAPFKEVYVVKSKRYLVRTIETLAQEEEYLLTRYGHIL